MKTISGAVGWSSELTRAGYSQSNERGDGIEVRRNWYLDPSYPVMRFTRIRKLVYYQDCYLLTNSRETTCCLFYTITPLTPVKYPVIFGVWIWTRRHLIKVCLKCQSIMNWILYYQGQFFSRESDSRIANVRLSISLSSIAQNAYLCPSVPNKHHALAQNAYLCLTTIMPISFLIFFRDF